MQPTLWAFPAAVVAAFVGAATSTASAGPHLIDSPSASAPQSTCSWLAHSDDDSVNAAYPDTSATYWLTSFTLGTGQTLQIRGAYPKARYFSFHTYTPTGLTEDSRYDAQIRPVAGGGNPFRAMVAKGASEKYVLTVRAGTVPKHRAPNTVYTGTVPAAGSDNVSGILIYRVYTPTHAKSAQGGAPLPAISVQSGKQTVTKLGHCATTQPTTAGAIDQVYDSLGYPSSGPPIPIPNAAERPVWKRSSSNLKVAGLFGNQQNAYLTTRTSLQYGQVLVIHGKAPTFPDTAAGVPAYTPSQVRYWSICQNNETTRVVSCTPDSKTPLRHHRYTIVISSAAARPKTATAAHGVAWLPWGPQPDGVLIYRNMVAAPHFRHATQRVAATANAAKVMGAYYPTAHYCSTASYDAKGPRHCTAS